MLSLYLQVLAIGVVWTSFHCAGMCGPLIAALTASPFDRSLSPFQLVKTRTLRVLSYQLGRAFTYALAGAAAGALGRSIDVFVHGITQTVGLLLAVVIALSGILKLPPVVEHLPSFSFFQGAISTPWLHDLTRALSRFAPPNTYRRLLLVGSAMGFLPCMLAYWVLAIAATSASLLHGALIMCLLVVMTTPVLVTASCSAGLGFRSKIGPWVISSGMILSGVWLALIACAANGWIEHVHVPFLLFNEQYTFMLW